MQALNLVSNNTFKFPATYFILQKPRMYRVLSLLNDRGKADFIIKIKNF